jgi:hypothetical protein
MASPGLLSDSTTGLMPRIAPPSICRLGFFLAPVWIGVTGVDVALGAAPRQRRLDYDIVYVRAPRPADDENSRWPEVKNPLAVEPGTDLVLLRPDGSEEVLVRGGDGGAIDPFVTFDGRAVYYSFFHDLRREALNSQRQDAPRLGADIYRIDLESRRSVRITFQEWTPNTGAGDWSESHLESAEYGKNYLGYGIFNLGPCPLPGGKVIFTSSRNGFLPNKGGTFPNLQLFVMDEDGSNVEQVGHLNLGSALHPTVLADGRVMFSSYEAQGIRDRRLWGLWAIWPDGRRWEPLLSAFEPAAAFHFATQLSGGDIVVEEYYGENNNGFGTLVRFAPRPPRGAPAFGSPDPLHPSNPELHQGYYASGEPFRKRYSFSPPGLEALTPFAHGKDDTAQGPVLGGEWVGKVTHPSGAPRGDLLLVWTPGPANNLERPVNKPFYDGGLYLLEGGRPAEKPEDLVLIKNDPRYNEMQPRAVVPYGEIYGVAEPARLEWLPNDGSASPHLPAGTPFGLAGASSFYRRDSKPGKGHPAYDGLDPFNSSSLWASSNWIVQGADAGKYRDEEIHAVRILAMEPTSHRSYGFFSGPNFSSHAGERLRILGEIPLRKRAADGSPILDANGNPDTSFLARIPADVPFTFQTLDEDGLVLNMAQTWHQLRPGEVRADCGGCHAHSQAPLPFEASAAGRPGFPVTDLARETPLLTKDPAGKPALRRVAQGAVDVEYHRDIKPILQRSCVPCHSGQGRAEAGLVLDDEEVVSLHEREEVRRRERERHRGSAGAERASKYLRRSLAEPEPPASEEEHPLALYEGSYIRLARDHEARYGRPPMSPGGDWGYYNASRYIRKFQSRRSLLIWKIFGRRLDGWKNDDHPTEAVPGDRSTFPAGACRDEADLDFTGTQMPPPDSGVPRLSEDEKMMFARWVDLGCPASSSIEGGAERGWHLDDLRPTLALSLPRAGLNSGPLSAIRIGAFDYYSGLRPGSLSVRADFPVNGRPAGSELGPLFEEKGDHIWILELSPPLRDLPAGKLTVSIADRQGNVARIERTFRVRAPAAKGPKPPNERQNANEETP